MKQFIIVIAIIGVIIAGTALTGCVRVNLAEKNGPITTKNYDFTDFTGIDIGYAFELVVTPSANYSVSISAVENVLKHINIHQDGTILVFEVDGWTDIWFSGWYNPKVNITMPVLTDLKLSGASKANVTGFNSEHDFDLRVSGASEIDLDMTTGDFVTELSGASHVDGHLIAASSHMELSGASHIKLTGSGGDIRLEGSGASDVDLKGYTVDDVNIDFSGASHISLDINGRLDVSLSGVSSLDYTGNPVLGNIDITGSSSMNHVTAP
jgi:hypothetical protein